MARGRVDKWEEEHKRLIASYEAQIKRIYNTAIAEAVRISGGISYDDTKPFSFADHPLASKQFQKLQQKMAQNITAIITNGVNEQWALSDRKTTELIQRAFKGLSDEELDAKVRELLTNRDSAREAFLTRKEAGLGISDRVWNYTDQYKEELEMSLDLGMRDGLSADALSREVRGYLNNPNMLFRRVRDAYGVLHLSERAKAYHPGRGVYRSSYKNARRLAATEINIAYRTADHDRWQQLDFVVGVRVQLSNNHTLNGKEFYDICDELSAPFGSKETKGKGCYPKDFKFTGWHPLCRCFATPILKTEEEMDAELFDGIDTPPEQSANYVGDVPDEFKAWVQKNGARVARSLSLPYFMQDNAKLVAEIFHAKQPRTNMSRNFDTTMRYISKYVGRDARIAAIYDQIDNDWLSMSDMERTMLVNRLKTISANLTYADMRNAGVIPDGMIMARVERDFVVQRGAGYTIGRQRVDIKEMRMDMIVLRDKYGQKFAYPVGSDKDSVLLSPEVASEQFHSLPRYLTKGMERVSFYGVECPMDKYWKVKYRPDHISAATDGGQTSFWAISKGMSGETFKRTMAHEAAHWLDTRYSPYKYSSSTGWAEAVNADITIAKQGRGNVKMYPTEYAETNLHEDFAESMALFLTDRRKLKDIAPNRERYLHNLTKYLGSVIQVHNYGTR